MEFRRVLFRASSAAGTEIRVVLPAAFASVTPVSAEALQSRLDGWNLLDFDDRTAFEAGLKASVAHYRTIVVTYVDPTGKHGRASCRGRGWPLVESAGGEGLINNNIYIT